MGKRFFYLMGWIILGLAFSAPDLWACKTIAPEAVNKGVQFVRDGKPLKAIDQFNIALADIYHNRGAARQIAGQWAEAMTDFNKASQLNPQDARPDHGRAQFYIMRGKFNEALEELDASIALKKDFIKRSYALRAWIHTIKGDLNFALKDYNTLLADYPESHIFLTRRGFIYYWKKNLEGALADFNQALKVNPDVTVAYFGRNLVYSAQGNGNQAKADMEKVRQSDDGLAEHYFNRSNELRRYGLGDMAEVYMKYALMIKPNLRNRRLID